MDQFTSPTVPVLHGEAVLGLSRAGVDAELKYHTQTADVNLNNLWNVNVAIFFPLKDQRPYLPRIKLSWGENNKFQREMDVKTDRREEGD